MTPPIDILAIAADHVAAANAAIRGTMAMQAGPAAERAYWYAVSERELAMRDMGRVQWLVEELNPYNQSALKELAP